DQEQRAATDLDIARISECLNEPPNVVAVVFGRVRLVLEDVALLAEPSARPGLVSPGEAERKIGLAGRQHFVEGSLEQTLAMEPIMPVTKALDTVFSGQLRLGRPDLREAEVVEAQVRRQVRLVMSAKQGPRPRHVGPLREAFPPPLVVLRNGMELRQIKRDQPGFRSVDSGSHLRLPTLSPASTSSGRHLATQGQRLGRDE